MNSYLYLLLYSLALLFCGSRIRHWSRARPIKWNADKLPPQVDCEWCGYTLRQGSAPAGHGVCDQCRDIELERHGRALRQHFVKSPTQP